MQTLVWLGLPQFLFPQSDFFQPLKNLLRVYQKCSVLTWSLLQRRTISRPGRSHLTRQLGEVGEAGDVTLPPDSISAEIHQVRDTRANLWDIKSDRHKHPVRGVATPRTESVNYAWGKLLIFYGYKIHTLSPWQKQLFLNCHLKVCLKLYVSYFNCSQNVPETPDSVPELAENSTHTAVSIIPVIYRDLAVRQPPQDESAVQEHDT